MASLFMSIFKAHSALFVFVCIAGKYSPFVEVDLKKWKPDWWGNGNEEEESDGETSASTEALEKIAKQLGGSSKTPKRDMDILAWVAAFGQYSRASAVVPGQMAYKTCIAHKDNCLKIAKEASSGQGNRRAWLANLYDRMAR